MAEYLLKGDEVYLAIDGRRLDIIWNSRWVPAAESLTILPSEITLSKKSYTLHVGGSYTLSATVAPDEAEDKSVSWGSLNPEIASVSSTGKVVGESVGEAEIVCWAEAEPSVKAVCNITVEE